MYLSGLYGWERENSKSALVVLPYMAGMDRAGQMG